MSRIYNFSMENNYKRKIGLNIKSERVRKEYTQERIAESINVSVSHISKIEQGITSPTAYVLYKISQLLEVPMEDFFKGI